MPSPRFRLYTTPHSYLGPARDLLLGRAGKGDDVARLEADLAAFLGVPHVVCVPQNRVGIYLTLTQLIAPGQDVVMSPYTIADVTNMVILAGGRPVFADVDRGTCNISAAAVQDLVTPATGAVLITHLHGLAAPVEPIRALCEGQGVPLLEDTAQAFGARWGDRRLGTIGRAGVFSFGTYKNVNGWLGGAVASRDAALIEGIRARLAVLPAQPLGLFAAKVAKGALSDLLTCPPCFNLFTFPLFRYGFLHDVEAINRRVRTELDTSRKHAVPAAYLSRMTPMQARIIRPQLSGVDGASAARIARARVYHEGLRDLQELIIPPWREDYSHIYTYFPIQYPQRERLLKHLMAAGRDLAAQHYKNNAALPGFVEFARECPNAARVAEELIFLPTYPRYPVEEARRNVAAILAFFRASGRA